MQLTLFISSPLYEDHNKTNNIRESGLFYNSKAELKVVIKIINNLKSVFKYPKS